MCKSHLRKRASRKRRQTRRARKKSTRLPVNKQAMGSLAVSYGYRTTANWRAHRRWNLILIGIYSTAYDCDDCVTAVHARPIRWRHSIFVSSFIQPNDGCLFYSAIFVRVFCCHFVYTHRIRVWWVQQSHWCALRGEVYFIRTNIERLFRSVKSKVCWFFVEHLKSFPSCPNGEPHLENTTIYFTKSWIYSWLWISNK